MKGYSLYWILTIIILIFFGYHVMYKSTNKKVENLEFQNLKNKLISNLDRSKVTIMQLNNKEIRREDCELQCDAQDCLKMKEMEKMLKKCTECHTNPNKCFRKSIIGGNCDDCEEGEKQMDCSDTRNFGCAPPHNIQSYDGSLPYFLQVPDYNLNSPYDKKCVFCWQLSDYAFEVSPFS